MNSGSPLRVFATPNPTFDRRFAGVAYGFLVLAIAFFTYLHYCQPQILRVPSNSDVSTWKNPAFEETCIYDRMTEAERAKIRAEGLPNNNLPYIIFSDVFVWVVAALCFLHVFKYYGFWMASCFVLGSFAFTGMQESMWILTGRFTSGTFIPGINEATHGSYWFSKGGLWFIETPVAVCLGWFVTAYACVLVAGKVFPRMSLFGRAVVGGLIAMGTDLWLDPVATSPEIMNWIWAKGDFIRLFGIPHCNFMGWFLLIAVFAVFWEWLPAMERRWNRLKATLVFFSMVIVGEAALLGIIVVVGNLERFILISAGVQHGLQIPPGW